MGHGSWVMGHREYWVCHGSSRGFHPLWDFSPVETRYVSQAKARSQPIKVTPRRANHPLLSITYHPSPITHSINLLFSQVYG